MELSTLAPWAALVGLGADTTQPSVQVTWPDGKTESFNSVPIDQWGVLRQGTGR